MAALACALANGLAAVALATVLAPATPLVPDPAERLAYVREHLLVWRVGWGTWMVAALTLLWFTVWWRGRVGGPRAAVAVAAAGLVVDLCSEVLLVASAPDRYLDAAPLAYFMTGAIANGLYTVAGIMLTLATRLSTTERAWAALLWSAGLMLSLGALAGQPLVIAIATAALFVLFVPWCVYLRRKLGP